MNAFASSPFFGIPSQRRESAVQIVHHIDGREVDFTEAFSAFVAEVEEAVAGELALHRWEDDGGRVSA